MELLSVATAISTIKNSIEIARALQKTEASLEKAELKLKITELIETLADVRLELIDVEDKIRERERIIDDLYDALENKAKVVRQGDGYYEMNTEGVATGDPYCSICWEHDHRLVHLFVNQHRDGKTCGVCKAAYSKSRVPII